MHVKWQTCKNAAEYWRAEILSEIVSSLGGAIQSALCVTYVRGRNLKLSENEAGKFGLTANVSEGFFSAFRTTSNRATLIVAGTILVDILGKEMSVLYHARR